jgi:hypothetical protein
VFACRIPQGRHKAGLDIEDNRLGPTFADLRVTDPNTGESSDIQLGVNYRAFPPTRIEMGLVLDVRDAVAGKMSALWSRGEVRDFIDIDAVVQSGRFTRQDVLVVGDQQEALPMDRRMLAERFRSLDDPRLEHVYGAKQFTNYGVDAAGRAEIVRRFAQWANEIGPR